MDTAATSVITTPELGSIYINARPWALTISDNLRATFTFDREGRPLSCFLNGGNYRFGISGDILLKMVAAPPAPKLRRLLSEDECVRLHTTVHAHVVRIVAGVTHALSDDLRGWLAQILAWDEDRALVNRRMFQSTYLPISIVPPDQYRALVLQMTEGCSWNRCTFCSFYRDRHFRVKSPVALRQHIQQVKALLGRGLGMRRSIFLGDANALIVSQQRLRELLQVIHDELPAQDLYAFLDIFGAEQKTTDEYAELRAAGVRRVYIGLESGDEAVFNLLNKPGSPQQCITTVERIKMAGIHVGIILLAGVGGQSLAPQHVAQSLSVLTAMGLDAGDLVYISPLIVSDDSDYTSRMRDLGIVPLSSSALDAQMDELKAGARLATQGHPRVALYHIEEWLY
ncbi:MAG: radical SAM protein [Chloroflexales bacterium]